MMRFEENVRRAAWSSVGVDVTVLLGKLGAKAQRDRDAAHFSTAQGDKPRRSSQRGSDPVRSFGLRRSTGRPRR